MTDAQRLAWLTQGDTLRMEQASLSKPLAKVKQRRAKQLEKLEAKALERGKDLLTADSKDIARRALAALREEVRGLAKWNHMEPEHLARLRFAATEMRDSLQAISSKAQRDAANLCTVAVSAADDKVRARSAELGKLKLQAQQVSDGLAAAKKRVSALDSQVRGAVGESDRRFAAASNSVRTRAAAIVAGTEAERAREQQEVAAADARLAELERRQAATDEDMRLLGPAGTKRRAERRQALTESAASLRAHAEAVVRDRLQQQLREVDAAVRQQRDVLEALASRAAAAAAAQDAAAAAAAVTEEHERRADALKERLAEVLSRE